MLLAALKAVKQEVVWTIPLLHFIALYSIILKVDVSLTVSWQLKSWIKNKYEHKASKTGLSHQQHDNNQPYKNEKVS